MSDQSHITIQQARARATARLQDAGVDTAALDARVLLAHVLGESPTGLLIRDPEPISKGDLDHFSALVQQRETGVPVAYLIGQREFMGLPFHTAPGVLVPRPDTEPLVEWGLEWLNSRSSATVADIGTGSGAIAIATVYHAPRDWNGTLIATDVSEGALAVASANADSLLQPGRRSQLGMKRGSLTEPLTGPVDLLLTNLPYLTPQQIASNPGLVHEPRLALDGGVDGLDLIRALIQDLPRILAPGGAVGFEIDPSQAGEVQRLLSMVLPDHHIGVVRDLAGDDRHVIAY